MKKLDSDEIAGVIEQWRKMATDFQVQADRFEAQAAKPGISPELVKQFRDASRQWHDQAQVVQLQTERMEKSAPADGDTAAPVFNGGGVSVIEKDGHTIIKKDGKTLVDVPSKSRDRSSRSFSSSEPAVPIVFIVFLFLFLIVKTIMGPINRRRAAQAAGTGGGPGLSAADSVTLQKIHRTLGQMERRVEALETILADPRRTAAFTTVTRPSTTPNNPSTSYESKV